MRAYCYLVGCIIGLVGMGIGIVSLVMHVATSTEDLYGLGVACLLLVIGNFICVLNRDG